VLVGGIEMTPFSFEWAWDVGHCIFFGLLYLALAIIGTGIAFTAVKTGLQLLGFMRERHFH